MLTFVEFLRGDELLPNYLKEGGNVRIGEHEAQAIDLKNHERDVVSELIMKGLVKINQAFKDDNNLYIWKPGVLKNGDIFSGSTKHFFDSNIATEDFLKHKKSVGDIDLMVDEELKSRIETFMEHHVDEEFEHVKLIGSKKSGDQHITLWRLEPTGINVQMDFEYAAFKEDKPTEWSRFSHSSSFEDMENGIKGAFHKLLMTSLLGHKKTDAILQMKTKRKEIKAGLQALSVKGLRQKYEKIGDEDGKPVIRETNSKDWVTNFYAIMKEAFDVDATAKDVERFWSFVGILELIKKYMDRKKQKAVLESFAEKLWGDGAQGLYRGDPNKDFDEKMVAYRFGEDKLGVSMDKDDLEKMQKDFYENYK